MAKAKTFARGDWFEDVSEHGKGEKYILMCVATPCKMTLIAWPRLGPYASPVEVRNISKITEREFDQITQGTMADFVQIARPKRISVPQN
jgi:hypothetical protein